MKTSYNEACARDCSTLEKDLALCEKAGFDYIEIRLDLLRGWLKEHTVEQLKEFFETHRLKPHAINAVYLHQGMLPDETPDWDDPAMQDFKLACEVGSAIGADRIVRAVDEDNAGFVFDSYNIHLNGHCNDFSAIKNVQPEKIFAVHLMSADDVPESEMGQDKRCFAGTGVVDTDAFLQTLRACGYDGMVSVETFRPEYWAKTPEWVIENAYRTTYAALEKNQCL